MLRLGAISRHAAHREADRGQQMTGQIRPLILGQGNDLSAIRTHCSVNADGLCDFQPCSMKSLEVARELRTREQGGGRRLSASAKENTLLQRVDT